ncbi:Fe3+ hydroxamate ABC transporter substrate-binding protein [Neobacillus sp. 179-C4.2 HS]|uniref:Fe3+ hydroxamate ABC transporter substrate-binding protein n=1 Tax=Neobacillus driksii TaxID=3035913 RepID=A0ABV4YRA0_9BACI|nr:Fe3+ hydroxamate ABC transporter substrate-binding protein [Neobacillus sp. 179.-C4.2 HS]
MFVRTEGRLLMLWDKPNCMVCEKEIKEDEIVFVKMKYPKRKGFTEIKAYLRNEGKFVCQDCIALKK